MQISSSPHIKTRIKKNNIMALVLTALLPVVIASVYFFGLEALLLIITSVTTSWITDIVMQKLTKNKQGLLNLSSILTGLLLALVLPPTAPLWIAATGSFIAVSVGKYAFGIGNSIFNPALLGRAFLVISWPNLMSSWITPDGVTKATPLANETITESNFQLFIGNVGGCLGETSAAAVLIGGLFLIYTRIIDWKIPTIYIGSVVFLSGLAGGDPLKQFMAGGLLLGAFFMATDYVTSPLTNKGKIYFALGCGILTFLFRFYSTMPEGVMYSILLMNALTPLIDKITTPKPFGYNEKT